MKEATAAQLAALTVPATVPGVLRRGTPVVPTEVGHSWRPAAVDLTDATGRAHVAWAIAAHCARAPIDPALVCWRYSSSPCDRGQYAWDLSWESRRTRWSDGGHVSEERYGLYLAPQPLEEAESQKVIPSLVGLDPCDPTRLPDGSRWVDAEALRLVALHVLGTA